MTTYISIDDKLVNDAVKAGKHKTKKEAVNASLKEYVRSFRGQKIKSLFGTIEYNPHYNYKKQRSVK